MHLPDDASLPFCLGLDAPVPPGYFTLGLVRQGVCRLLARSSPLLLPAGTLFLVPPGSGCALARGTGASLVGLGFRRSLVDPLGLDTALTATVELLASPSPRALRLRGRDLEEADAVFAWMEREGRSQRPGFAAMLRLKIMEAVLLLAQGSACREEDGRALRFHPEEALLYVREHCTDPLTLAGMAARYGMNASYFSRLFHAQAGISLVDCINRERLQRSCQLLKRSDAGVADIALAVGYNNLSYFNRIFRRAMGVSPREYRASSRR